MKLSILKIVCATTLSILACAGIYGQGSGVRVSGRVTVPAGGQLPSTAVLVSPSFALPAAPLTTAINADGTFEFSNIAPGAYTVRVAPFAPLPPTGPGLSRQPDFPTITVDNADVTNVSITVPVQFDYAIRFVIDAGDPLPSNFVQVAAQYGTATRYSMRLPNGGSSLPLPPGEYAISLQGLPTNYSVQSITYGAVDLLNTSLKADSIPTSEILVTIALFPPKAGAASKVRGNVTNLPPRSYLYNPQVRLARSPEEGGGVLEAPMNDDGTFEFPRVPPGKYTLNTFGMASSVQFPVSVSADILEVTVALTGIANPFPEFPGASFAGNFASTQITLQGVITQEITIIRPPAPVVYFRMDVTDATTGRLVNWPVLLSLSGPARSPADIPDTGKLKVGTHITIQANPDRNGANRASLVRDPNANTALGIKVD